MSMAPGDRTQDSARLRWALVVVCGPSGSGRSCFGGALAGLAQERGWRALVLGVGRGEEAVENEVRRWLAEPGLLVLDGPGPTRAARRRWLELAGELGVPATLALMAVGSAEIARRDLSAGRPNSACTGWFAAFEWPAATEDPFVVWAGQESTAAEALLSRLESSGQ